MSKVFINEETLTAIGNAIREKNGSADLIAPGSMADTIRNLPSGGGDNKLLNAIIDGSVNEFINNDVEAIRAYLFVESSLTKISCANVLTIGLQSCGNTYSLAEVNLPKCRSIDNYSFRSNLHQNDALTTIDLPECEFIGIQAFVNRENLSSVNFPKVLTISSSCFYQCFNLTSIKLPCIRNFSGNRCFRSCSKLQRADFGDSNKQLSLSLINQLFQDCSMFDTLILRYPIMVSLENTNCFNGTLLDIALAEEDRTGYIYVPSALIEEYKVATNWAAFETRFRAIEDYPDICGEA